MLDSHFQDAKDICWTGSAATCLMCQIWLSRVTLAFSCVESACQRDGEKLPRASCAWRKLSFAHRRSCTVSTEKDFACLQPYPILYKLLAGTTAYRTKRTKAPFPNHYPVRRWALLGGSVLSKFWLGMLTLAIDRHNANFDATDYMQIFRVDHQYHHVWTADKTRICCDPGLHISLWTHINAWIICDSGLSLVQNQWTKAKDPFMLQRHYK